uniref:DUF148 domain-containing protein n=1 Tax=Rhabditophanes sp. KR3021 TaxID=114890 RepID=A0AC35U6Z6_9BILA
MHSKLACLVGIVLLVQFSLQQSTDDIEQVYPSFLESASPETKSKYETTILNNNLSKNGRDAVLDALVENESDEVKSAYNEYKAMNFELEKEMNDKLDLASGSLDSDSKKIFDQIKEVILNKDLTMEQAQSKIDEIQNTDEYKEVVKNTPSPAVESSDNAEENT